jgi:hypothetical protein
LEQYPWGSKLEKEIQSIYPQGENKMKKVLTVVAVMVVAVVIFGAGIYFAQYQNVGAAALSQGYGPSMLGGRGGYGVMHDYVEEALAAKLGLTEAEIEAQLSAGKSMYQIALDKGIAEADVPALLAEVHKTAFDKAVADGVLTQAQADAMLQNMTANGAFTGTCPMFGSQPNGAGYQGGRGRMMGGGRWNQQAPQSNP